jgi:CubicO group peptidase (beta-lactamase class C family)
MNQKKETNIIVIILVVLFILFSGISTRPDNGKGLTAIQLSLLVVLLLVITYAGFSYVWNKILPNLKRAPGAVGISAKQLCTLVYVCGFEPERARQLYINRVISPLDRYIKIQFDSERKHVRASLFGIWSATAAYREGIGCTLLPKSGAKELSSIEKLPIVKEKPLSRMTTEKLERNFDRDALEKALERAFSEADSTLAVAVLSQGELIAERYAAGVDSSTPLPGWSMGKSITATLAGILEKQGKLDIHQAGIVPEWQNDQGGGQMVTMDHLLRMTSGLDLLEDQTGTDPNTRMLFQEPDMAAYSAQRGLKAIPGENWQYMSGSTLLASRAIVKAAGGTLQSSQSFMRETLFTPIGASSFLIEPDYAGTFVGSSYPVATAYDWAKFGQLYLDDGVWEGEHILPEGWRAYVTSHTPESGTNSYGAGFWTTEHAAIENVPKDTFFANGFQGQFVIIVPSHSLVIVRLGASLGPTGIWKLVEEIIAAKR